MDPVILTSSNFFKDVCFHFIFIFFTLVVFMVTWKLSRMSDAVCVLFVYNFIYQILLSKTFKAHLKQSYMICTKLSGVEAIPS